MSNYTYLIEFLYKSFLYSVFFFFQDNLMVIFMLPGKPQIHQVYFL